MAVVVVVVRVLAWNGEENVLAADVYDIRTDDFIARETQQRREVCVSKIDVGKSSD